VPIASSRLWREPDFRRLWIAQTVSQLGEHTTLVVLPLIAVLVRHAGSEQVGALRALGQAPLLLFSLLAGAWVDGWRTRTVMMAADLGRAVALAAAVAVGVAGLPVLFAVAFAVGTLSVFFDVAYQASLVRLLRPDQLAGGNSAVEGSRSAAQMGGPALGGALVSLFPGPAAAACGALFFLLSSLSIRRIRRVEAVPARRPEIRQGLRFVRDDPALRTISLASAAFQFSFAALMTAYLVHLPRELGLSGGAIGLVLAATGPGALAGSFLAARRPARFGYGRVLVLAAALGNGVLLCVPALTGVAALITVNLVFGALSQLVNVTVMVVRQAITPDGLQGRVAATITFAGMGLTPLGSLAGGGLTAAWGTRGALTAAALGMLVSPLLMALSPLTRLGRVLPAAEAGPTRR
jgi:MFS family permease